MLTLACVQVVDTVSYGNAMIGLEKRGKCYQIYQSHYILYLLDHTIPVSVQ